MQEPTIEVIIPTYNAQDFIVQAIDSVKSQTYRAVRTMVIDDGSTDLTAQVIRKKFGSDPDITYIHKENGGPSSARNRGIAESKADLIAFLDADDIWLPTKLSEQVELFQSSKDPKLGAVYCDYGVIDRSGNPIHNSRFEIKPRLRGDIFNYLLVANRISGSDSGVLVKKKCFDAIGGFDESLQSCEDWDMWLRLARNYHFDYVEKTLSQIRRHDTNIQLDTTRMCVGYVMFFNKWVQDAVRTEGVVDAWRTEFAPPMIGALIRELPKAELYRLLAATMSPEVKHLALTQIPQTAVTLLSALARKTLNR